MVRFEWENFSITVRRLLSHEVASTMNSESVWLAIAKIIISRERSQHFLLKGRNSGIELMLCKCTWVCAERRLTLIHKQNNKWHHNYSNIIKWNSINKSHKWKKDKSSMRNNVEDNTSLNIGPTLYISPVESPSCHNGFPLDLDDHKNKWSRHWSFLYGCDRSPDSHDSKSRS